MTTNITHSTEFFDSSKQADCRIDEINRAGSMREGNAILAHLIDEIGDPFANTSVIGIS
jgi:hypothetical protein